ncbi:hypothetical protein H112_02357 [Trichophyton rubrum D6]|uniref:DUF7729 domain-containing protein n=5 Tax=Trichophyton TaxID=5550 RepID=A0A178F5P4_TRIRU|nr:uncharacterized protein TERG_06118 [Trichophyton rubrum CBS 118892]EZF25281.1 hypothetical protein H100_02358 [Trichophyton rubrum MR850]EZF44313.1 hypothetical protein H102_02356 [Trichophyton rubrum CBS 100081]EZF54981.1 hypothetical protein H103_02366 [Trichophyton rubrum CBS 288.86]EZF65581.1 hypothetical protein H104_02342 [Trichophyton rubrum CBS 289.86]EZF76226.1 hypothetical protein H105_02376 [Trichophyton soudanense CBS 452.61]EZF86874.1 hypothetical protein H110_02362 [Trichophy
MALCPRLQLLPPTTTLVAVIFWALILHLLGTVIIHPVNAYSIRVLPDPSIVPGDTLLENHQFGSGLAVELRPINVDARLSAPTDTANNNIVIQHQRQKRDSPDHDTATPTSKPSVILKPSHSGDPVKTSIIVTSPTVSVGPAPTAFDTNRSENTTTSCMEFFDSFLSNATFNDCIPVSVLLTTSSSFFQKTKTFSSITQTLGSACAVDADKCTSLLSYYAEEIGKKGACNEDLTKGNPLVIAAKTGFLAYRAMRDATCLTNPETNNYCFAEAITDPRMTANVYIYHLALGYSLSAGRPKCGKCLPPTMKVLRQAAGNKQQPVSEVYVTAATQVNVACGPNFVTASLSSGACSSFHPLPFSLMFLLIGILGFFLS